MKLNKHICLTTTDTTDSQKTTDGLNQKPNMSFTSLTAVVQCRATVVILSTPSVSVLSLELIISLTRTWLENDSFMCTQLSSVLFIFAIFIHEVGVM